jgi:hypothetical protein
MIPESGSPPNRDSAAGLGRGAGRGSGRAWAGVAARTVSCTRKRVGWVASDLQKTRLRVWQRFGTILFPIPFRAIACPEGAARRLRPTSGILQRWPNGQYGRATVGTKPAPDRPCRLSDNCRVFSRPRGASLIPWRRARRPDPLAKGSSFYTSQRPPSPAVPCTFGGWRRARRPAQVNG